MAMRKQQVEGRPAVGAASGEPAPSIAQSLRVSDRSALWQDLPPWLAFFFALGERVAAAHENGTKTCAVVIPPVRSFAAVFASTGAVLGVAATARSIPDLDAHYETLCSLPNGTAVVVKMGERIYSGTFRGLAERSGITYLRIEYNDMTQYLPRTESHRVQIGKGGKRSLPKSGHRRQSPAAAAVHDILGERAADFLSVPTVDAVLVGQVSLLQQELTTVSIQRAGSRHNAAPLAALLRASRFLPDGEIPRSLLLSDRVAEFEMPVDDTPHVAVFDSPRAFSRYRSAFPDSSWIAVLDRCSRSLQEGADVANEEFAVRRGPAPYDAHIDLPDGTEFQAFERGR